DVMSRLSLAVVVAVVVGPAVCADDWPMLGRDRTHNAVSPEKGAPTDWQNAIRVSKDAPGKAPRNIKWSAQLGSGGMGGPVVAEGLVWIGTNNQHPRDGRDTRPRQDGRREPIDMSV